MNDWNGVQDLGIVVVTLLLDSQNEGPPSAEGAQAWKNQFGLSTIFVVADPGFSLVDGSSVGTPMFKVVDPRTMTVVYKQEGSAGGGPNDPKEQELLALANANKAAP
jgi:hypothetical protein